MRPTNRLLFALALVFVLAGACGGAATSVTSLSGNDRSPSPPTVRIEVTEDPSADSWSVTYTLPGPATAVAYLGNRNMFRKASWRTLGGPQPLVWQHLDGREVVRSVASVPFDTFTVQFATDAEAKQKDYGLNLTFTDGSRLLYTGHLDVIPLTCSSEGQCTRQFAEVAYQFVFRTSVHRKIRLLADLAVGKLTWRPPAQSYGEGTYVYFGTIAPIPSKQMTAIIDPGMPAWMVQRTKEVLPQLFSYFAEQTGVSLNFRPLVLMSFVKSTVSNLSHGGGTLDGLVQLAAEGAGWEKHDAQSELSWFRFLAHEAFHLWNGRMFSSRLGVEEEWLIEGAADFFSFRALLDGNVIDERTFHSLVVDAANRCITNLRGKPLLKSHLVRAYKNFYTCGSIIHFVVDQRLRRSNKGSSAALFTEMFRRAKERDGTYTTFDYLELYRQMADDALAVGPITQILHIGIPSQADEYFSKLLRDAGLPVQLVNISAAQGDAGGLSDLSRLLAGCDCGRSRSVTAKNDHLLFHGLNSCAMFKQDTRVSTVSGHHIIRSPRRAYQAARNRVLRGKPIQLGLHASKKRVALKCANPEMMDTSFSKLLKLPTN